MSFSQVGIEDAADSIRHTLWASKAAATEPFHVVSPRRFYAAHYVKTSNYEQQGGVSNAELARFPEMNLSEE